VNYLTPLKLDEKLKVEQVIFDLDHTLWDFETNARLSISELYDEFNLAQYGFLLEEYLPVYIRCNEYCWEKYRMNKMRKDLLRHQRFYLSLKDFGLIDRQLSKKIGKRYVEISPEKTALMPGTTEILDYLAGKYPLHIITNGFEEIQSLKLKNSGIDKFFNHVITSEKAGKRKPEPKIFQYALHKIKCSPSNAIMIGDDLESDVKAATNAGLHAIWYNHHQYAHDHSHRVIHHLSELKKYL